MKVIILAAGRGTRLQPLTDTVPKPLIKIVGKTILEHNLESIYTHVDEIILVVKYLEDKIKEFIGNQYKGVPVFYHTQGDEKGTGAAIKGITDFEGDTIIMAGDQIFEASDIEKLISSPDYGCLVQQVDTPENYGIFSQDENGYATTLVEKPQEFIGDLANISFYKLNSEIFDIVEDLETSERGEIEITDGVSIFMQKYPLRLVEGSFMDIGSPWHILEANGVILKELTSSDIKGEVEEGVVIKGNIILEEGAVLKSGTYIEGNCYFGKNSIIGPNAYIRGNTSVGEWSKVGFSVEMKNSSIGDNTKVPHLSYVGDSVVGNNVNLGGGFAAANLRHDNKNIRLMVNGVLTDTGRRKFGCVIGDNVKTGANTTVYPGRILDTGTTTLPNEIVK